MNDSKPASLFRSIPVPDLIILRPQSAIEADLRLAEARTMYLAKSMKQYTPLTRRKKPTSEEQ